MLGRRLVVVALLACSGVGAGCGKGGAGHAKVVPGARAGVVIETSGEVSASRAGQPPRVLHKGDVVSGDDEIHTGADGSVLIQLDHNHVTFTLPAGRTQQVAASLAWNQPIASANTGSTDEYSAAAGRAVERSAVDTSASSAEPTGKGAPPVTATAPAPPTPTTEETRPAPGPAPSPAPARDLAVRPHPPRSDPPPPPKPTPPPEVEPEVPSANAITADEGVMSDTKPGAADLGAQIDAAKAVSIAVTGDLSDAEADAAIRATSVTGCWKTLPAKATVTITVDAHGKVSKVSSSDRSAASCLGRAIKPFAFPAHAAGSVITLTVKKP